MTPIFLIIILMTMMGSVASLFLKKASASEGIRATATNPNLYAGGALYLAAALLNIYVLRLLDYSVVLPLTSLTYIWTMLIAYTVLKERISRQKIAGVVCLIIGACFVTLA